MQQLMHLCHPMLTTPPPSLQKNLACMDIEEWGSFCLSLQLDCVSHHTMQSAQGCVAAPFPPGEEARGS